MGPRFGLQAAEKRKLFAPAGNRNAYALVVRL